MSILAYTGLPGHGKSYGVVENVILPALRMKRVVYTNIPLDDELCINDFGMSVVPFDIQDIIKNPFWFRDVFEAGSILVLDECWRLWPSGLKANAVREGDKEFLAEHRHLVGVNGMSTEIYLVTQDLSQIASFARALVENTFRVTKLISLGTSKAYRVDVYFGAVTGAKPNPKNREREIFGKFSKEVYKYYKSHTKSQSGGAGDETRTDNRFGVLGRLSLKLGFLFVVLIIIFCIIGSHKVYDGFHPKPKNSAPAVQPDNKTTQPPNNSPVNPANTANTQSVINPPFLSLAKHLFVGFSIKDTDTNLAYYVVQFQEYAVTVKASDLESLGYELTVVNDCLVKVTGYDFKGFFMCPVHQYQEQGLLAGVADDVTQIGKKPD